MKKVTCFIFLFISVVLFYGYYKLCYKIEKTEEFKEYLNKNKLDYIKTNSITKIDIGPYNTKKNKFYTFNPSIELDNDGEIIGVIRISNWTFSQCELKNNPDNIFKKNKKIDVLDNYSSNNNKFSSILTFKLSNPENTLQIVDAYTKEKICFDIEYQGLEDPRVFSFRNNLWIYCHYRGIKNDKCIHTPVIFNMQTPSSIIFLFSDNMTEYEKNWIPFVYKDELYFEYMISPHTILHCNVDTGYCKKVYESNTVNNFPMLKYNNFGGGAPSKLIKIQGKEYFIGIAHTSLNNEVPIRKNFFYLFRAEPPFDIIMIGTEFNIIPEYRDIEFASGLLLKDDKVLVSCGISDCYGIIAEIDLDVVLDTLYIPFKNLTAD